MIPHPREAPNAAVLLARTREAIFPLPRWALFPEVANETGMDLPELRRADAIAVLTTPGEGWVFVALEVKRSRADLARELAEPEKAAVHDRICERRFLVVPSPWKDYLPGRRALSALPDGCGLIEAGAGGAVVVVPAVPHAVDEPPRGFLQALYRAAAAAGERLERDDVVAAGVPLVPIVRYLSRGRGACGRGHELVLQLLKKSQNPPRAWPCLACHEGLPAERAVVLAALEGATEEDLAAYLRAIDHRAAQVVPDVGALRAERRGA